MHARRASQHAHAAPLPRPCYRSPPRARHRLVPLVGQRIRAGAAPARCCAPDLCQGHLRPRPPRTSHLHARPPRLVDANPPWLAVSSYQDPTHRRGRSARAPPRWTPRRHPPWRPTGLCRRAPQAAARLWEGGRGEVPGAGEGSPMSPVRGRRRGGGPYPALGVCASIDVISPRISPPHR